MRHLSAGIAFAVVILGGGMLTVPVNTAFAYSHEAATIFGVGVFAFFLYALILLAVYLLPGIIALVRKHHNTTGIMLLNILLGWTFLFWIVALIWACLNPSPATASPTTIVVQQPTEKKDIP